MFATNTLDNSSRDTELDKAIEDVKASPRTRGRRKKNKNEVSVLECQEEASKGVHF